MKKKTKEPETFLKWTYVGDNKDSVVMVMDSETFEFIRNTLNDYTKLKKYVGKYESDMVNGFPCPDWRHENEF